MLTFPFSFVPDTLVDLNSASYDVALKYVANSVLTAPAVVLPPDDNDAPGAGGPAGAGAPGAAASAS